MIKNFRLMALSVLAATSLNAMAGDLTPMTAERFLLHEPPHAKSKELPQQYKDIERLTPQMFSSNQAVRMGDGYRNYLVLKNRADLKHPYAAYNVGLYQIVNREALGVSYTDSLLYLKMAADGGVDDALYSLALIYTNNTDQVAKVINGSDLQQNVRMDEVIESDKKRFRELGQEYILTLAQRGHERGFMVACNYFTTGQFFEKDITKAALCYNNAVKVFNSNIAKGLLAKIYFDVPEFDSLEFEKLGIQLSREAAAQGNVYAMVNLGKQLIMPKHIGRGTVDIGVRLLQGAAAQGDERAIELLRKHLGEDGVLRVK